MQRRNVPVDPQEGLQRVGEFFGGSRRVGGPSGRTGTGRGTLPEVLDGSGDPLGSPNGLGEPFRRSETGQGNPWGGLGRVGRLFGWSVTGRGTLGEVWNGLGDPRRGQ